MRRNVKLIGFVIIAAFVSCKTDKIPDLIKSSPAPVIAYPNWFIPEVEFVQVAPIGTNYQWTMTYKNSSQKNKYPDSLLFIIPGQVGKSFRIEVSSSKGNPAIMIWDRMIHKNDAYSILNGYDQNVEFPGNPITYKWGNNGNLSLCYTPRKNGVVKVWIWLLNGNFIEPPAFESEEYDDSLYDSLLGGLTDSMIAQINQMDSIDHVDYLPDIWENDVKDKKEFNKASVDISIKEDNCPVIPHYDYYQSLLINVDTIGNLMAGEAYSKADMKDWYELLSKMDSFRSISVERNRRFHQQEIVFRNELIDNSLESRLQSWLNHPEIQSTLLQRESLYLTFPGEEEAKDLFRLVSEKGEAGLLSSKSSQVLAQALSDFNGISAAIYDINGYLVSSTQPFTFMNIYEDSRWSKVSGTGTFFGTDCYERSGYGFEVKKVFVPIKVSQETRTIGWLLAELYCR